MTSATTTTSFPVLADALTGQVIVSRRVALDVALIGAGAAVVALAAQLEVPLWPVPVTGQTLAVLVVGAALGPWRGALSLAVYLLAGVAGLPAFAGWAGGPASILKPSFGFIIGFIAAAFIAGWVARRAWDRRPVLAFLGFAAASIVPFIFGVPYMAFILNSIMGLEYGIGQILAAGLYPFIIGGIVKAMIAAAIIPGAWAIVRRLDSGEKR